MKMITLKSSDEQTFEIEESSANGSRTIKHVIEDDDYANSVIPLPNVTSKILSKIIEYLKRHDNTASAAVNREISDEDKKAEKEALEAFDTEFVKVDHNTLFDLTVAANYLEIKGLLDLTCQAVANRIKEKTPAEIRQIFNVVNDFDSEKEEGVRKGNEWVSE